MADSIRIAAAQTPVFQEDLAGAALHMADIAGQARSAGVRLLCLPEGFLQGYLTDPERARRHALDLSSEAFTSVLNALPESGPMIVVGLIERDGDHLYNTAAVVDRRALVGRYRKRHLLGSERCFQAGTGSPIFDVPGLRFGVNICSDTNHPSAAASVAEQGASLLLCPANNLPPRAAAAEWKDKHNLIRGERCRESGLWLLSADVTGAEGDRVAWGPTAVLNPAGEVAAQLPLNAPGLLLFDLPAT